MRLRVWLAASMLAAVAAPIAAQEAAKAAAGEYGRSAKLEVQVFESANKQVRLEYPKKDWQATAGQVVGEVQPNLPIDPGRITTWDRGPVPGVTPPSEQSGRQQPAPVVRWRRSRR